jgi:hypothetical protein
MDFTQLFTDGIMFIINNLGLIAGITVFLLVLNFIINKIALKRERRRLRKATQNLGGHTTQSYEKINAYFTKDFMRANKVLLLQLTDHLFVVGMVDPDNKALLEKIGDATDREPKPLLITEEEFESVMNKEMRPFQLYRSIVGD